MRNVENFIEEQIKGTYIGLDSSANELCVGDTVLITPLNPQLVEAVGDEHIKAKIRFGDFKTEGNDPVLGVYLRMEDMGDYGKLANVFPFRGGKASIFHRGIAKIMKIEEE